MIFLQRKSCQKLFSSILDILVYSNKHNNSRGNYGEYNIKIDLNAVCKQEVT